MKRAGEIKLWDDGDITAGGNARQEHILKEVTDSDILLYLVSTDSLASENCNKELTEAVRAEKRVIPIILESCDWLNDRLSGFQALPDKGKPINKWQPESDGWQNVVDGIREAIEEMQVQADTPSGTHEKELRAALAFQQGNILMMIGQVDMAIERYSHAINLNPNYAEAYTNRGLAYHKKGDYDRAISDHNTAIDLNPNYAEAYFNRGGAYKSKNNYDHALADFTKAIEFKPDFAGAYNHRGVVYLDRGDYDFAIADFTKAIDLNPAFVDEIYYNRGLAYHKKGDYNSALADYTKAIDLNPKFVDEVYYNRGRVWLYLREWEKAKSDLTAAGEMGVDIIASFYNDYESVPDFEGKHGVKLPADLAAILTPQGVAIGEEAEREATHESASDFEIVLDDIVRKYDRAWKTLAKP